MPTPEAFLEPQTPFAIPALGDQSLVDENSRQSIVMMSFVWNFAGVDVAVRLNPSKDTVVTIPKAPDIRMTKRKWGKKEFDFASRGSDRQFLCMLDKSGALSAVLVQKRPGALFDYFIYSTKPKVDLQEPSIDILPRTTSDWGMLTMDGGLVSTEREHQFMAQYTLYSWAQVCLAPGFQPTLKVFLSTSKDEFDAKPTFIGKIIHGAAHLGQYASGRTFMALKDVSSGTGCMLVRPLSEINSWVDTMEYKSYPGMAETVLAPGVDPTFAAALTLIFHKSLLPQPNVPQGGPP